MCVLLELCVDWTCMSDFVDKYGQCRLYFDPMHLGSKSTSPLIQKITSLWFTLKFEIKDINLKIWHCKVELEYPSSKIKARWLKIEDFKLESSSFGIQTRKIPPRRFNVEYKRTFSACRTSHGLGKMDMDVHRQLLGSGIFASGTGRYEWTKKIFGRVRLQKLVPVHS